jgi:Vitamin K-dependent gamma-carboxylase
VNLRAAASAWNSFWFEPVSTAPLAVFRIVFGLVMFAWSVSMLFELTPLFSRHGILPHQPGFTGRQAGGWGLLGIFTSDTAATLLAVALIIASVCLVLGLVPQVAAVVLLLGLISFERRNPFAFNAGDVLLRVISFYLIFAPTGAALSVWGFVRDRASFWSFPLRAPWALRLLQIQLSVVYLFAVWTKVQGTTWNAGTAVSYALRITDISRFPVPHFLSTSPLFSNVFSYGTLVIELSLAILVWNRKLRPWVLLAGLSLHLGIEYSIRVGFYGLAVTSLYILFVAPARLEAAVLAVRRRVERPRLESRRVAPGTAAPS